MGFVIDLATFLGLERSCLNRTMYSGSSIHRGKDGYFCMVNPNPRDMGAVGPLVGVRYGQELARRFQKAQWIADNKKQEYKELLRVMQVAAESWVKFYSSGKNADDHMIALRNNKDVFLTIELSFFIRDELKENNVSDKW